MPFTDLPVAPAADAGVQPVAPAPTPQGFLSSSRKRAVGNSSAQLNAGSVCSLAGLIPTGAQSAIVTVEAANGAIPAGQVLMRFWMDGTWPSQIAGTPAYDGSAFEIIGSDDLANFRALTNDGNQHILQIQFFSYL